jgi:hypothetical protein
MRSLVLLVKLQHLGLAPWILFSIPSIAVLELQVPLIVGIATVGVVGMVLGKRRLVLLASISLLTLLILGKVTIDLQYFS